MRTNPNFRPPFQPSLYPEPWTWLWPEAETEKTLMSSHLFLTNTCGRSTNFDKTFQSSDICEWYTWRKCSCKNNSWECQNQLSLHCIHFPKFIEWADLDLQTFRSRVKRAHSLFAVCHDRYDKVVIICDKNMNNTCLHLSLPLAYILCGKVSFSVVSFCLSFWLFRRGIPCNQTWTCLNVFT